MSYEDQLIREATGEGLPSFQEEHEDYYNDDLDVEETETPNPTT